jgi:hypothetical protein
MKTLLRAALAVTTLAAASPALAAQQDAFSTSIISDIRPWDAGRNQPDRGIGARTGKAALPGKDRLLVVEPNLTTQVFLVGRTKVVDSEGKALAHEALLEGDQVRVDYDVIGNTRIARTVTVLGHPEAVTAP